MFFIDFPILSYPIQPHAIASIDEQKKPYAESSQSNFFIKLYTDLNTLWVKHTTHQKAEPLRAASLSKLGNSVNNNSICNTTYAEFSVK